jgi:hypothetical protein
MSKIDTKEVFVAVKNLSVIWRQSQRPFVESHAKKIAAEFDPDKFDPPVITRVNGEGQAHIVEGQHRVAAVKIAFGENEQLKCRMVDADDPARAAEIFLGINAGRKSIQPVAKFNVSVTALREPETSINKFVVKLGYRIAASKSDHCISAVSSMIGIHNRLGMTVLQATLMALDKTWPGDASAFQGDIIQGYAAFINEFAPYLDHKRLADIIPKVFTPHQLIIAGKLFAEQSNESLTEAMSEVLRSKYNRGLKEGQKLKRK